LVSVLTTLKGWLAILGVVLAVAGLSALLGWLKLRRRDMSLLLEANGWAVNAQMKVTRRIGKLFTEIPADPPGTQVIRVDSLAHLTAKEDKRRRRSIALLSLLLVACIALAVALRYYNIV
jgi:ABC-type branched-subunit amino acid transport system permease subunit